METYDDAAFDRFCSDLVLAGFSPSGGGNQSCWTGPIRASLAPLTDATRMRIDIRDGWPLRHAHVVVDGLRSEHDDQGLICLWADDDPAQVDGRTLHGLFDRLDEWAETARAGFGDDDRALDAHRFFHRQNGGSAEIPLGELIDRGTVGCTIEVYGHLSGTALIINRGNTPEHLNVGKPALRGLFHLCHHLDEPPRTFDDVHAALSRRQRHRIRRGLADRAAGSSYPHSSGGLDFIAVAWPRHGADHDAVVLNIDGGGDSPTWSALAATPNDMEALRRRAGPDAVVLADLKITIIGAGSVGGHVAVALASSGVGQIDLHDDDRLTSANLVRHVAAKNSVGLPKTSAVKALVDQHAPWTTLIPHPHLSYAPHAVSEAIDGAHLVIDCTGIAPLTAAVAEICRRVDTPLVTVAVFHHGALVRVQRQEASDTPIAARPADSRYYALPTDNAAGVAGFLELGCTAPVNNAPPIAVLAAASDAAAAAVDVLTGRQERPDERITVLRPMSSPFDRIGALEPVDGR